MHRRTFVQLLGSASAIALTTGSRALAQKSSPPAKSIPAPVAASEASPPASIVMPRQWFGKKLTEGLPSVFGKTVNAGPEEIAFGVVGPSGRSMAIASKLTANKTVQTADAGLSLDEINKTYNPFRQHPLGGAYTRPSEIFLGKAFIPVQAIIGGVLAETNGGSVPDAMKPVVAALSQAVVLKTPAHQFKLESGLGNRVVFYESEGQGKIGHTHLDRVIEEFNLTNHVRLLKLMNYLHADAAGTGSQGGAPNDIVAGGAQCGTHHVGGFSLGYRKEDGSGPMTLRGEWPYNYAPLDDGRVNYNPHLIAVDYRGGTLDTIPEETVAAYNRNADLWDCCAGAIVPFSDQDLDPNYRRYEFNPLEIVDQKSALAVALNLAKFDRKHFLTQHGAFYCAEGQFVVANLGPQESTLLRKSKFGNTEFGRRIENFRNAPGYRGMTELQRRRAPQIGWKHLASLGPTQGGISAEQLKFLETTRRTNTSLEWIPEEIKGWQAYRPRQADGLIARPMTVATLAWGLFRNYMPIDGISRTLVQDVMRAYAAADRPLKAAISQLSGGRAPTSTAGKVVLSGIALKAAVGFTLGILSNQQVRDKLLEQAGFKEIKKPAEQQKVLAAYAEFLETLKSADFTSQASIDKALWAADLKLSQLQVEREHYNKVTRGTTVVKEALMRYAAPTCFLLWTQHPFLAETQCLRYVATAMHVQQARVRPT